MRRVNNDRTETDQWDPAIAVKPGATERFIGCYSRQNDPITNSYIMAYGAKGDIANGLSNATFDCFPISPTWFPPLFCGTNDFFIYAGAPNWFQDDNTWADAHTNYFYYAWCDRSRTWSSTFDGQPYTRPDANVKFAIIKQ